MQEQGGESRILSLADKIAIIESNKAKRIKILEFLRSGESVQAERIELEKLVSSFKIEVQKIKEKSPGFHLHLRENKHNGLDLLSNGNQFYFHYYTNYYPPYLFVGFAEGYTDANGNTLPFNNFNPLFSERYKLDIDNFDQKGWSIKDSFKDFKKTEKFVEYWLSELTKNFLNNPENE